MNRTGQVKDCFSIMPNFWIRWQTNYLEVELFLLVIVYFYTLVTILGSQCFLNSICCYCLLAKYFLITLLWVIEIQESYHFENEICLVFWDSWYQIENVGKSVFQVCWTLFFYFCVNKAKWVIIILLIIWIFSWDLWICIKMQVIIRINEICQKIRINESFVGLWPFWL